MNCKTFLLHKFPELSYTSIQMKIYCFSYALCSALMLFNYKVDIISVFLFNQNLVIYWTPQHIRLMKSYKHKSNNYVHCIFLFLWNLNCIITWGFGGSLNCYTYFSVLKEEFSSLFIFLDLLESWDNDGTTRKTKQKEKQ